MLSTGGQGVAYPTDTAGPAAIGRGALRTLVIGLVLGSVGAHVRLPGTKRSLCTRSTAR